MRLKGKTGKIESMLHEKPLPILVGPTGVGKTAVAIELCELLDGEIVSADSMQLYRGLDIGTAKASAEEQARARHHLIDILSPDDEYSAARWAQDAAQVISGIRARGKQPIIVGGTGFYLTALLSPGRLASALPDMSLRAQLFEKAEREGNEVLHAYLHTLDADAATRLHPNDTKRVVRAIEVAMSRQSQDYDESTQDQPAVPFAAFGLLLPRELLYDRINHRVDIMLEAGFMNELCRLIEAGFANAPPLQNLGYRHMRPALNNPAMYEAAVELWKRDTRRYAKRQMTWFRHQIPVQWIDVENRCARETTELLAAALQSV